MKSDRDDPDVDPQTTLPPRHGEQSRRILGSQPFEDQSGATRAKRMKLGTPTPLSTGVEEHPDLEISSSVHRGFKIGPQQSPQVPVEAGSKTKIQPWILVVAAGAMVLLVLALLLRPSSGDSAEALANERLLAQYTKYLEARDPKEPINLGERKKDVVARLQTVAWAKAIGDKAVLEHELNGLLFLDNDRNSPLYQYSLKQLKQLGPSRKAPGQ